MEGSAMPEGSVGGSDSYIVAVAIIIAVGVNSEGRREVLGMTVGHSEAEPF